jgi:hypothetical protein
MVNSLLQKADQDPHLKDEKENKVIKDEITLMKIYMLVVLDYNGMSTKDKEIVHEFTVHSPPLIEQTERTYSNEILRNFP